MSRNKYPAKCYRCGKQVEAGQGHYERASGSRRIALNAPPKTPFWIAQHAGCAIRWRGTNVSIWRASPVQQAAPSGGFPRDDFTHTANLLRSGDEAVIKATLSNNLNVIIAALDRAAVPSGEGE